MWALGSSSKMPSVHMHTRLVICTTLQDIVWWQCILKTCYLLFSHLLHCL